MIRKRHLIHPGRCGGDPLRPDGLPCRNGPLERHRLPAAGKYLLRGSTRRGLRQSRSYRVIRDQFKRFGDSFVITTRYGYPPPNEKMNELLASSPISSP